MAKRRNSRRSTKNIISRGLSVVKTGTRRTISGVKGVGNTVVGTASKVVPKARSSIRSLFGMFGLSNKKGKSKSRRTRRKR